MNQVIRKTLAVTSTAIRFGCDLLCDSAALLAGAAEPASQEDTLNNAVRGGKLNYRTGELDDGTDAAGWYERD